MSSRSALVVALAIASFSATITACDSFSNGTGVQTDTAATFLISGNPEAPTGAAWSFRGTVDGVAYDLTGVLYKPVGAGPFPAVLLSHGAPSNAAEFAALIAPTMVRWGLVCIAPNYTHSAGVPLGLPGNASQPGASHANALRAHMTVELLARLGYVDMSRVAIHGHSFGAYANLAAANEFPNDFRVASLSGGGLQAGSAGAGPAPTPDQVAGIRTPFQMHHGDADATVPLSYDQRLDSLFTATALEHQLFVYPGEDHLAVRTDPTMFARVRAWYTAHGMFQ